MKITKRAFTVVVLIGLVLISSFALADELKTCIANIYSEQPSSKIKDWKIDAATKTIVVLDAHSHEQYRISTETGRVYCGSHEVKEKFDLEHDGG